jgi:hypothetical protein
MILRRAQFIFYLFAVATAAAPKKSETRYALNGFLSRSSTRSSRTQ